MSGRKRNNLNLMKINRNAMIITTLSLPYSIITKDANAMVRNFFKPVTVRHNSKGTVTSSQVTPLNPSIKKPMLTAAKRLSYQNFGPGDKFEVIGILQTNNLLADSQKFVAKNDDGGKKQVYAQNFINKSTSSGSSYLQLNETIHYGYIQDGIFFDNRAGQMGLTSGGRDLIMKFARKTVEGAATPQPTKAKSIDIKILKDSRGNQTGKDVFVVNNETGKRTKVGFISNQNKFFGNQNTSIMDQDLLKNLETLATITPTPPSPESLKAKIASFAQTKYLKFSDSKHELVSEGIYDANGNPESIVILKRFVRAYDPQGEPYNKFVASVPVGKVNNKGEFIPEQNGMNYLNDNDIDVMQPFTNTDLSKFKEGTPFISQNKKLIESTRPKINPKTNSKNFNQRMASRYHPSIHGTDGIKVFFSDPNIPGSHSPKPIGEIISGGFVKNDLGRTMLGGGPEDITAYNHYVSPGNGIYSIVIRGIKKPPAPSQQPEKIDGKGSLLLLQALKSHIESSKKEPKDTQQKIITSGTISVSGTPTGTKPKSKTTQTVQQTQDDAPPDFIPPPPPSTTKKSPKDDDTTKIKKSDE